MPRAELSFWLLSWLFMWSAGQTCGIMPFQWHIHEYSVAACPLYKPVYLQQSWRGVQMSMVLRDTMLVCQ